MDDDRSHSLEQYVGQRLQGQNWTLATAESCTGGLIGHRITQVPGSSTYFLGGVVSYADKAKIELLGVQPSTLSRVGAVSRDTALEMARGVRQRLAADVGISVTGIAGPSGGSAEKPVGLTWIAIVTPRVERAQRFVFEGDRSANKEAAAAAALEMLLEELRDG
ncbi:MAG: CinA family protein [Anaerolineales bacterium]|nr:CinA family protein [Anaerolineales bacterium]